MCLCSYCICGQDVERLLKEKGKKMINIKGSIMGNAVGDFSSRDSISEMLTRFAMNANLNINIYDVISMPFSACFSSSDKKFNRPSYREIGVSPKYKYVTLHAGYNSLSLSEFIYSGTTFLGAGIELKPENTFWSFQGFYGKLANSEMHNSVVQDYEESYNHSQSIKYSRPAFGGKITLKGKKQKCSFVLFKAKDGKLFLDNYQKPQLPPEENIVTGIIYQNSMSKNLKIEFDYSFSIYTRDVFMPEITFDTYTYLNNWGGFFIPKASTIYSNALKSKILYRINNLNLNYCYKRIDPEYNSMGMPYICNDTEEHLLQINKSFGRKISISGSFGGQINDLSNRKVTQSKRIVGNLNASYKMSNSLLWNVNYANYSIETRAVKFVVSDSIRFLQVTENAIFTVSYSKQADGRSQRFLLSSSNNSGNLIQGGRETHGSQIINFSFMYKFSSDVPNYTVNTVCNYNNCLIGELLTQSMIPSIALNKSLINNKLKTSVMFGYPITYLEKKKNGEMMNVKIVLSYKIDAKQKIRMNAVFIRRNVENSNPYTQSLLRLSYSTSF